MFIVQRLNIDDCIVKLLHSEHVFGLFPLFLGNSSASAIIANLNSIPELNGSNFKFWKEIILIVLESMDLDYALRVVPPSPYTDKSSSDEIKNSERWERSNRMCLIIMKRAILENFRGVILKELNAKKFLDEIEKRFAKNEKVETNNLLSKLVSLKYKVTGNIRERIMKMFHLALKLKAHLSWSCQMTSSCI